MAVCLLSPDNISPFSSTARASISKVGKYLKMNSLSPQGATNPNTKFRPFRLQLSNGAYTSGIAYIPSLLANEKTELGTPLLIGIHGATSSAYNYDVSNNCTASVHSDLFGVPFVAINRPNYLDSSGWLVDRNSTDPYTPQWKITPGRTYFEEEARWFHELIFPAIWKEFGISNGCTSIVTTSHSIGVVPSVIAAGMYAEQDPEEREYVWAGTILSGLAPESTMESQKLFTMTGDGGQYDLGHLSKSLDLEVHAQPMPPAGKTKLMLSENCCAPGRGELVWKQTTPLIKDEGIELYGWWQENCLAFQARVRMPVLCALGSADVLFQGTRRNVEKFGAGFVNAASVENALVYGAPHAIELSYVGNAWYRKCFAWAQEKAIGLEMESFDVPCYD